VRPGADGALPDAGPALGGLHHAGADGLLQGWEKQQAHQ
jgi:hypothetical protein